MNEEKQSQNSTNLSSQDSSDIEFDLEMAEIVWQKCKGYPIPECYSVEDRLSILQRYWHRAMEKE